MTPNQQVDRIFCRLILSTRRGDLVQHHILIIRYRADTEELLTLPTGKGHNPVNLWRTLIFLANRTSHVACSYFWKCISTVTFTGTALPSFFAGENFQLRTVVTALASNTAFELRNT